MKPHSTEPSLAELFFETIPLAMRKIRHEFRNSNENQLTVPQLRVVAHVYRGVSKASELAELQGVSNVAISKMIQALVIKGFIKRSFEAENRKQNILSLTSKGQIEYLKIKKTVQNEFTKIASKASQQSQKDIQKGLAALKEILKQWESSQRTKED